MTQSPAGGCHHHERDAGDADRESVLQGAGNRWADDVLGRQELEVGLRAVDGEMQQDSEKQTEPFSVATGALV
jgi:hypothetical protein